MQRHAVSLEQQQAVMQQMEAARVAVEDAHRQHLETSANWRRTGRLPLCLVPNHDLQSGSGA